VPGSLEDGGPGLVAVAGTWRLPLAAGQSPSSRECTIGVHFEDLVLDAGGGEVEGVVLASELLGPERRVLVRTQMGDLGVRVDRDTSPAVGSKVGVRAAPGSLHVFDKERGVRLVLVQDKGPSGLERPGPDAGGRPEGRPCRARRHWYGTPLERAVADKPYEG